MNENEKSVVVAITGGIGSGKSTVAGFIKTAGYKVLFLDDLAKQIMLNDNDVKKKLINAFGSSVYSDDGVPNHSNISEIVFGSGSASSDNLNKLNKIVHPPTIDEMIKQVEILETAGEELIFIESAIIFEAGIDEGFDYIITVSTEKETAIQRTIQRTGLTAEQVEQRMKQQMSNEEKAGISDFVIDNNFDLDALKQATDFVLNIIKMSSEE